MRKTFFMIWSNTTKKYWKSDGFTEDPQLAKWWNLRDGIRVVRAENYLSNCPRVCLVPVDTVGKKVRRNKCWESTAHYYSRACQTMEAANIKLQLECERLRDALELMKNAAIMMDFVEASECGFCEKTWNKAFKAYEFLNNENENSNKEKEK